MSVSNVAGNASVSLLLNNQVVKQQKKIQKLSLSLELLPEEEITGSDKNVSKNSIGLHKIKENRWQQLLQACNSKLNVAKEDADLSESIRSACDTAGILSVESLLAEITSVTYQMEDGKELSYLTFYEKDRIYCKKEGEEDYEWEIPLQDETQYDKVMSFLDGLEEKDNQSFTIHNTFWQDFLSGKLDVDEFKDFLAARGQGDMSDAFKITDDGTFFDREAMKYAIYTYGPEFGANIMRTTEELMEWQEKQMAKAGEEWEKTHLSWVEQWNKEHPDLAGKKCFLYKGRWYTVEELDKLWDEEFKSDGTVFI